VCAFKTGQDQSRKKLNLLAGKSLRIKKAAKTKAEKKTKSFGGKIVLRKKSLSNLTGVCF